MTPPARILTLTKLIFSADRIPIGVRLYVHQELVNSTEHTYIQGGNILYVRKKNLLILVFSWALIHFLITLKAGVGRGKDIFNSV